MLWHKFLKSSLKSKSIYWHLNVTVLAQSKSTYSNTVNLPKTSFPQRIEGQKRIDLDHRIVGSKPYQDVYYRQLSERSSLKNDFVLHDGPPYANGDPHLGHAVNKILKDVTIRWKMTKGCRVHYRPGWDCHGLPIELKARQASKSKEVKNPLEIREMARDFAAKTIEAQKREFISWGVMGDWSRPYVTMDPEFVKNQFRVFLKLYKNGTLFQRYMPVYWSPSSRTALAESELEYNHSHKSKSVYVRFPVIKNHPLMDSILGDEASQKNVYFLVWTTTPWTLVANKAICVKNDAQYVVVRKENEYYIVAKELIESSENLSNIFPKDTTKVISNNITGSDLVSLNYQHPLAEFLEDSTKYPVFCGDHVTLSAGTGLVHTAPAHGPEDYLIGIKYDLDLECKVDELGCYDAKTHPELSGLSVLDQGNQKILDVLSQRGHILLCSEIEHSYPYDWRTKKPVILRASKQWFVDTKCLQEKGLKSLDAVKIHPKSAENGFQGVLENRPYWCVSRQRVWGVPIPVFYNSQGDPVVSSDIVERCCSLLDKHGTDFWWKLSGDEILERLQTDEGLTKGGDIFDVWLDSGITWHNVVQEDEKISNVVDLYLEGQDQFSGWFYSSLLTSLALKGVAPYKTLYVHGFTLDENGRKMSKSLGNVINPSQITEGKMPSNTKKGSTGTVYGVDVLRWWVASHGCQGSAIHVGKTVLDQSKQEVDKIRNMIKFLLGNIPVDMKGEDCLPLSELLLLDRYILHILSQHQDQVCQYYDGLFYNKICQTVNHFVANQLSAFYLHLIKDRLYCQSTSSTERRSAISALWHILNCYRSILSPILPILVAEMSQYQNHLEFIPLKSHRDTSWSDDNLLQQFEVLNKAKFQVQQTIQESGSKDFKQLELFFQLENCSSDLSAILLALCNNGGLEEFFQAPVIHIAKAGVNRDGLDFKLVNLGQGSSISFASKQTSLHLCPRCRLYLSKNLDSLCTRCYSVVNQ